MCICDSFKDEYRHEVLDAPFQMCLLLMQLPVTLVTDVVITEMATA